MVPPTVTMSTLMPTAASGQETFSVSSTRFAYRPSRYVSSQPKPKTVNLLDDSPPLTPIPTQTPLNDATNDLSRPIFNARPSSLSAKPSQNPPKKPAKPLKKSLFDDDLEDDYLSCFLSKPKPPEQKPKSSLFDDDDLDLDFKYIFDKVSSYKINEIAYTNGHTPVDKPQVLKYQQH
ncbi:WASH complex subunit 2-like [Drosophila persimilis]|uniref:WASH complex subunit 2-like n=1 Tax=Drosophila persimilis TaxID=7234 RepID=UPI000F088CE3|nr:WASH complex subunit 2-like [Drosophila persimilis]